MRARLLGWAGQVGIIFERKRFFERMLFEQNFLYIYKAYFSFKFLSKFGFFFERTLIPKNVQKLLSKKKNEFRKNVIRSINLVPMIEGKHLFKLITFCKATSKLKHQIITSGKITRIGCLIE